MSYATVGQELQDCSFMGRKFSTLFVRLPFPLDCFFPLSTTAYFPLTYLRSHCSFHHADDFSHTYITLQWFALTWCTDAFREAPVGRYVLLYSPGMRFKQRHPLYLVHFAVPRHRLILVPKVRFARTLRLYPHKVCFSQFRLNLCSILGGRIDSTYTFSSSVGT